MSFTQMKNNPDFYKKFDANKYTKDELQNIYTNVFCLKKILEMSNKELKKDNKKLYTVDRKKYVKKVKCEYCNETMTNMYWYNHKKSAKHKINMENKLLKEKLDKKT